MTFAVAWTCPFCGKATIITPERRTTYENVFTDGNRYGTQFVRWTATTCPNPECREYALELSVFNSLSSQGGQKRQDQPKLKVRLVPRAEMRVIPSYVPQAIRADYQEACLTREVSPKASATLARRCLQGMIRDFWGVAKPKLIQEIQAIEDKVDPFTWKAIDAVRKMGNIGAHMEKDINVIVDVDEGEAGLLIQLLETLFEDWYIDRHERQVRTAALIAASDSKDAKKAGSTVAATPVAGTPGAQEGT
jgi:hypothetical protein